MKDHPLQNVTFHKIKQNILKINNKKTAVGGIEKLKPISNIKKNNNLSNKNIILSKTQTSSIKKQLKKILF